MQLHCFKARLREFWSSFFCSHTSSGPAACVYTVAVHAAWYCSVMLFAFEINQKPLNTPLSLCLSVSLTCWQCARWKCTCRKLFSTGLLSWLSAPIKGEGVISVTQLSADGRVEGMAHRFKQWLMNRDGKQITLDYWRQGIVFMKMLIVSARLIPGVGEGWSEGKAARQPWGYW